MRDLSKKCSITPATFQRALLRACCNRSVEVFVIGDLYYVFSHHRFVYVQNIDDESYSYRFSSPWSFDDVCTYLREII